MIEGKCEPCRSFVQIWSLEKLVAPPAASGQENFHWLFKIMAVAGKLLRLCICLWEPSWCFEYLFWEILHRAAGYAELYWKHAVGLLWAGGTNHSPFITMFPGHNA